MLTRSGVAKRLGKSIATIRRLEGQELFPVVDGRGVRRFPDDQVHRLLLKLDSGDRLKGARGAWLSRRMPARVQRQHPSRSASAALTATTIERTRVVAQREVALVILDLLDVRQLRRLGPDFTDYLESLLGP